jgi:hypothetical protein
MNALRNLLIVFALAIAGPALATIPSATVQAIDAGNGATTVFNYSFLIPYQSDGVTPAVTVSTLNTTTGALTPISSANYTISGVGNPAGGSVTYNPGGVPVPTGTSVVIQRAQNYVQPTAVQNQSFYPHTVEQVADWDVGQTQQLANKAFYGVYVPLTDTGPMTLPSASVRANGCLTFDGSGNPTISSTCGGGGGGAGTVTSITAGACLTGGTITTTGTIAVGTLTSCLDSNYGSTEGEVLYRGASAWLALAPGTNGQFLETQGAGQNVQWAAAGGTGTVTSVVCGTGLSGGTITTTGTCSITAPVPVSLGGTNATSASITAFNNITGYTAAGATGTTSTNLVFSTSPSITTPTLTSATAATSLTLGFATGVSAQCLHVNTSGVISGTGSDCSGTGSSGTVTSIVFSSPLTGGTITTSGTVGLPTMLTGTTYTADGVVYGNGTSALGVTAVGSAGQVLTSNGAGNPPTFQTVSGVGTVTSVATNNGITGGTITTTGTIGLASIAAGDLLSNITAGSAAPTANTLTATIDKAIDNTQGDILYRSSTVWTDLGPGTAGQLLKSGGAAANPSWVTPLSSVATSTGLTGGTCTTTCTISLATIGAHDILSNITGSTAAPIDNTLTATIDAAIGSTQGDILYRNSSSWVVLAPGTNGQALVTGGASANPSWGTAGLATQGADTVLANNTGSTAAPTAVSYATFAGALQGTTSTTLAAGNDSRFSGPTQNIQNNLYTFVLSDAGGQIMHSSSDSTARNWAIPANSSVAYAIGTKIELVNDCGAGNITLNTTDTLEWFPSGNTGSRTIGPCGQATLTKLTATEWSITGVSISYNDLALPDFIANDNKQEDEVWAA